MKIYVPDRTSRRLKEIHLEDDTAELQNLIKEHNVYCVISGGVHAEGAELKIGDTSIYYVTYGKHPSDLAERSETRGNSAQNLRTAILNHQHKAQTKNEYGDIFEAQDAFNQFINNHQSKTQAACFFRTTINYASLKNSSPEEALKEVLQHALYEKTILRRSNRSKNVCVELDWIDQADNATENAPAIVKKYITEIAENLTLGTQKTM